MLHGQRIIVFELKDVVPRFDPKLPCIFVTSTTQGWEKNGAILRRKQHSQSSLGSNSVHFIEELSERELIGVGARDIAQAKKSLAYSLASQGYTVNPNPTKKYIIYVARIGEETLKKGPGPWAYVGMTSKTADERLADLEPGEQFTTFSVYNAVAAETAWGLELQKRGFKVVGPQGLGENPN